MTFLYPSATITIEIILCEVNEMEQIYTNTAKMLKAISDPKRLQIVDMLSCGELCACKILEAFHHTADLVPRYETACRGGACE